MSRKYCEVCREPHSNPQEGLCDKHLEEQEERNRLAHNEAAEAWTRFMNRSDEERWEMVFDFMRSHGWDGP